MLTKDEHSAVYAQAFLSAYERFPEIIKSNPGIETSLSNLFYAGAQALAQYRDTNVDQQPKKTEPIDYTSMYQVAIKLIEQDRQIGDAFGQIRDLWKMIEQQKERIAYLEKELIILKTNRNDKGL